MIRRSAGWIGSIALLLLLGHFALTVEMCKKVGYVCENTGSTYGYRLWPGGLKTSGWSRKSAFEAYLEAKRPEMPIENRWSRSAFVGTNIFGQPISFSDGPLGGMASLGNSSELQTWMDRHSEEEIVSLYEFFRKADHVESRERAESIREEVREYSWSR